MQQNTIQFTVVIPVYNGASSIARAIDSCLCQTVLPEQIIVVDDGSSDNTAEKLKDIISERILYRRNEKNYGPSYSRNMGMRLATTQWIAFLDADDVFHPRKLEIIQNCIANNENIRAIGHAFDLQKSDQSVNNTELKHAVPPLTLFTAKEVLWRNPMVTPSLVVSVNNKIYFDEAMAYAEDHDFILRTAEKYGIYYLGIPLCSLARLPLTPGGISSNKWKMRKGEMRMYAGYAKRHKNYPVIPFLWIFSLLKHLKNRLAGR